MAAPRVQEIVYGAVSNIPAKLHSKHLRNYFSQFLEVGGFDCFHFRHRPERKVTENREGKVNRNHPASATAPLAQRNDHAVTTVTRIFDEEFEEERFPRQPLGGDESPDSSDTKRSPFYNQPVMPAVDHVESHSLSQNSESQTEQTCCCIIRLCEFNMKKLVKMYNKRNWVDEKGNMMPQLCHISWIRLAVDTLDTETEVTSKLETPRKNNRLQLEAQAIGEAISMTSLMNLQELNPPDIMPNGNVGTPTSIFNELIRSCRLPPKVITRLGIVFPKSRTNKRYGNVPLKYGGKVLMGEEIDESVVTASGHEIFKTEDNADLAPGTVRAGIRKRLSKKEQSKAQEQQTGSKEDRDESRPDAENEDDDSGEEWDRHVTLHDDVTNQERTTERLFENEMEVTWDKGSSGLVFYTDAAYWDKAEGDFDQKTSDDWDIDMSAYYDSNGGDMDARHFIDMRREQRMKLGMESTSVFKSKTQARKEKRERRMLARKGKREQKRMTQDTDQEDRPIGDFEKHTRGFGRKLMEAQGWVDGEGLGNTIKGVSQALENIGQNSHDKRGIGYYGKKLNSTQRNKIGTKRQHSGNRKVLISTIYDDPKVNDPAEPLLRSQGPYQLKYRKEVQFTKSSEGDVYNAD